MKRIALLLLAALLLGAVAAPARTPKKKTVEKLVRITRDIDALKLERNRLLWHCYLADARRTGRVYDVSEWKAVDVRRLCDTVPELRALSDARREAYARWQETLRTDSMYQEIHDEYQVLKRGSDRAALNANARRYDRMYARLARSNPDYVSVRREKNKALREYNFAVLEHLTAFYAAAGRELPTDEVMGFATVRRLRAECPQLGELETRQTLLEKLRRELEEQILREQYGIERRN